MKLLTELTSILIAANVNQKVRDEFVSLVHQSLLDEDDGIRDSGRLIAMAIREKANGWLEQEDMILLLEAQRDIAHIRANNAQIALNQRIQALVIRLIDITLMSLTGVL